MATDMGEVVGQENMEPEAKSKVIELLQKLPLVAHEIKHALNSWGHQTGANVTYQDLGVAAGIRKKRRR